MTGKKKQEMQDKQNDILTLDSGDTRISSKDTRKLIHKGNVAYRAGNFSLAAQHFLKAWNTDQENLYLLTVISHSLAKLGNREVAIELIEKAIAIHGVDENILRVITEMALDMDMFDIAEKLLNHAIQLNPAAEEYYTNLVTVIERQGRPEEAIALMREVVKPFKESSSAWCHLAALVKSHHDHNEAITLYKKSLELDPKNIIALNNYARICGNGKIARSLARRALKADPTLAEPHTLLATSLLLEGRLKEGWKHYEHRNDPSRGTLQTCQYTHKFSNWNGSSLKGKHVFVACEQGIGDEVYFAASIEELVKRGAILYLGCDKRLIDIYERSFEGARAFEYSDSVMNGIRYRAFPDLESLSDKGKIHIDYAINIGSIPKYFWHKRDDVIAHENGYLCADPIRVKKIKETLNSECTTKLKIGISWRSGIVSAERTSSLIGLQNLLPLISNADADFICLQYGFTQEELDLVQQQTGKKLHVIPNLDLREDIDGNLALIKNLDIVIGPSIATQMFSMALGVKTWVLSSGTPWWKYRTDLEDKRIPHAPNAKLWTRTTQKSWPNIVEELTKTIKRIVTAKTTNRLIFIDIPQCAGTSMLHTFNSYYGNEHVHMGALRNNWNLANEIKSDIEYWSNIKVFTGHYPFGFAEFLPGKNIYGTFLRDPIEREISAYYYCKRTPQHPLFDDIRSGKLSFIDFIQLRDNQICRFLHKRDLSNISGWGNQPADELYENALNSLNEMAFIGIASEFEKSIQLMAKVCGWNHTPDAVKENQTFDRPQWGDLSNEEQEVILANTDYDRKLYAIALDKFHTQYNENFINIK